jgi:Tfp pilus assembly protein PilF
MSLISDALKAAQRERMKRRTERPSTPFGETVLPYTREANRLPRWFLPAGFALAVVASVGTALLMQTRTPSSRQKAPSTSRTAMPNALSTVAPSPAAETRAPQTRRPRPPAVSTPAAKRSNGTVARPARSSATLSRSTRNPIVDSGIAGTREASPGLSAGQPSSSGTGQVHLVIDSTGTRAADSLARLAYAEHAKNNLERARDLYEKAIATKQAPAEALNNYGALLVQQGNMTMAAEMFRQATASDETNVDAWVNLGDTFIAAGNHGSARSAFDRARQLDPSRASINLRLASEYLEAGDTTGARRTYEEVVRTHPDDARAHHAYGTFLQASKDYRGAIREFDLFVQNAGKSGEFTPEKIDEMRRHVASLRRVTP